MADKSYTVTDRAPKKILGRRVKAGDTLSLPEAAARYEVDVGHLEAPADPAEPEAPEGEAAPDAEA